MALFMCLAFSTNVQAQTCAQNSVVSLDAATCQAVILLSDLSPGATSFYDVTLKEPGEHAGTPIAPMNGGVSVVVSTPGKYKYQVDSESGCWAYFHVEDKTGPKCIAGPDALPNIYVSCTFEGDLTDKFATVGASSFMDCSGLRDSDAFYTDEKVSVCPGDLVPGKEALALPDGWSVCEVIIRRHNIIDWDGNVSTVTANCTQYLYVLRPTVQMPAKHVVGTLSHEDDCEVSFGATPKNPWFTDLGAAYWGSGEVVELENNTHYCKWVASITEGEKIYTCTDKDPTNTATYKQLREIALIDWCGDAEKQFLTQLIDVVDEEAPVITPGTPTEWANPFDCTFDVRFSASTAWDCVFAEMSGYIDVTVTSAHANYSGGSFERHTFDPAVGTTITGVPKGAVLSGVITAWDACGNSTDRPVTYTVVGEDQHAPVCISNDELFVSLIQTDHNGEGHSVGARVYPEDLDDSSYDNCGIASMHVRLEGGTWADYVEVSITDGAQLDSDNHACSTERWVELRITDNEGLTSTCKTLVVFTDNTLPVITAPADGHITCLEHPSFGTPDLWGFCGTMTMSEDSEVLHCADGQGKIEYYTKTWTVSKELKGGTVTRSATQTIYVSEVRDEVFTFPVDYKEECLDESDVENLGLKTIHEMLDNKGCGEWVMNVDQEVFEKASDACFKIIRTYDFINWCDWDKVSAAVPIAREENAQGKVDEEFSESYAMNHAIQSGRFSYTQIIKVTDTADPTGSISAVVGCDKKRAPEGSCHQAFVEFTVSASDLCSDVKDWSYEIDADTDYSDVDGKFTQVGNVVIGEGLPAGTYTITVTVSDKCGNTIWLSETATVTEFDCEAPEVIGLANFTTLNEHCHVDIWLTDVLTSASDNCDGSDYGDLTFGMELANDGVPSATMPTAQSVRITAAGVNTIALWAADAAGNTVWTLVPINARDNDAGTCAQLDEDDDDEPVDEAAVVGKIANEFDEMVDGVMISAEGTGFSAINELYNGIFNITVPMTSNVTVTPTKDNLHSNGVNTADIVVLQRHLLGLAPLSSAYQLIAADVNNDNDVTTKDLLHMSRLTIGIYDEFPNTTSWRFVDKNHTFANPTSPWGFPESVDYASLSSENQADFIGIKIGDLTGNAKPSQLLGSDEPKVGAMTIAVDDVQIAAGATQEIEFTASDFSNFAGYQFTIQLAEGVTLEGVKVGDLPNHSDANFALNRVSEGIIATNWANANAVTLEDGAVLFTLTVSAANNINVSEAVAINSAATAAEAYNDDLEAHDVTVQFNRTDAEFALYQNTPNPFSNETIIGFNLSQAGTASLKVMDVAGRVLKSINGTYTAGFHQITLNKSDLGATGVLYYQLDTESNSATKKMVIVE